MNTNSRQTDKPVGIRYILLMIPLFAAVIFAAAAIMYPKQLNTALDALNGTSPLANPEITITSGDGGVLYLADSTFTELSSVGEVVPVVRYDTETADGMRVRLLALDSSSLENAYVLTDGRMPQNETECVITALDTALDDPASAASIGITIGSAIRPCGEDGEVLCSAQSNTPCMLTVVGIGENVLSALAPISEDDVRLIVYTTADACWVTPDTISCLYLTDCTAADPAAAVQDVYTKTQDDLIAHRASLAKEHLQSCITVGEEAEHAVIAHQITVQAIENRLDTAELRVAEAEANMMNAVAELQAERQAFVSDMEYNEYYALRQVDLIPRRDRAEEGFAKQEEAIALMNDALHTAYMERDAVLAELKNANHILAELQENANRAHDAIEEQRRISEQLTETQTWNVLSRAQNTGHTALTLHAASFSKTALLSSIIAALIFLIGSITVYAASRTAVCSVLRFTLCTVFTAIPGILLGGCVLTALFFTYTYPALNGVLPLPIFTADTAKIGTLILLVSAGISAASAAIGCQLRRKNAPAQPNAE